MNEKIIRKIIREELNSLNEASYNIKAKSTKQKWWIEQFLTSPGATYESLMGGNLQVVRYDTESGNAAVLVWSGRKAEPSFRKSFRSKAQRESFIQDTISAAEEANQRKIDRKNQERQAKAALSASIKIGDLFFTSWGYEQTNLNYYKVVNILSKSTVEVIEVGQIAKSEERDMSGYYYPNPAKEIGSRMKARIIARGLKIGRETARPADPNEAQFKSSYY